jgi:hypothetical protein
MDFFDARPLAKISLGIAAAFVGLTSCGSDSSTSDAIGADSSSPPEWVQQISSDASNVKRADDVDGADVWVDDEEEIVYTQDCDLAEELVSEGGEYGPHTDAQGEPVNGYADICQD